MSRGRHKPKGLKRRKSWHRGKTEARRWRTIDDRWPDLSTDADPTAGAPTPLRRDTGHTHRGDTA
jgi:hypothetical protein